ncbi:MAG: helix-turn-helix transcriptional regulator [Planctomycetes bacterium]|nr:helix-turn-helix transcriptional regulator [Planctomycetota bacterium]
MAYRWDLLPGLAAHIEHAQADRALRLLDELLAAIAEGMDGDHTLFTLRCAQCMSACMRGARRGGAPSDALFADHIAALKKLARARTRAQAQRLMRAYVQRLADQVQPAKRSRMERIVVGMLADMREHLDRPRSLAQYSHEHEISIAHLSRAFARIAGRPFREEQARLRDERACELLKATRLGVAEIAHRVGLRSASQFIADFKAVHGCTPARYRSDRT